MNRILFFFLKKLTSTEKGRLELYKHLYEQTENEYSEQTIYGNLYNASIEFLSQIPVIRQNSAIESNSFLENHERINSILSTAHMKTVDYISENKI